MSRGSYNPFLLFAEIQTNSSLGEFSLEVQVYGSHWSSRVKFSVRVCFFCYKVKTVVEIGDFILPLFPGTLPDDSLNVNNQRCGHQSLCSIIQHNVT